MRVLEAQLQGSYSCCDILKSPRTCKNQPPRYQCFLVACVTTINQHTIINPIVGHLLLCFLCFSVTRFGGGAPFFFKATKCQQGVSKNRGGYPQIIHFNRVLFSIIFTIHVWGVFHPTIFGGKHPTFTANQELSGHILGYSVQTANSFDVLSVAGGGDHVLSCREVQDLKVRAVFRTKIWVL